MRTIQTCFALKTTVYGIRTYRNFMKQIWGMGMENYLALCKGESLGRPKLPKVWKVKVSVQNLIPYVKFIRKIEANLRLRNYKFASKWQFLTFLQNELDLGNVIMDWKFDFSNFWQPGTPYCMVLIKLWTTSKISSVKGLSSCILLIPFKF